MAGKNLLCSVFGMRRKRVASERLKEEEREERDEREARGKERQRKKESGVSCHQIFAPWDCAQHEDEEVQCSCLAILALNPK